MSPWVARVPRGTVEIHHQHPYRHAMHLPGSREEVEVEHAHVHPHTDRTALLSNAAHPVRHRHRHLPYEAAELERKYAELCT